MVDIFIAYAGICTLFVSAKLGCALTIFLWGLI